MQLLYRIAADVIVVFHFAYVAFVVVGFLLILIGIVRRWRWIRNLWFRFLHLMAILIVAAEAVCGVTCPLTTWENDFRKLAGETIYQGSFIAKWAHAVLFFDAEPWMFDLTHTLFGLAVLVTFALAPPRWKRRMANDQ
jgi:hypothetical protein